jgi:hypothetical protein
VQRREKRAGFNFERTIRDLLNTMSNGESVKLPVDEGFQD